MTKRATKSPVVRTLPDVATMEAYAATHSRDECEDALSDAQTLAFEAVESRTARARKAKAMEALATCPLCADGFNILAGLETDSAVAVDLYRRGVRAAELAIGPEDFKEFEGEFWGFLETRPYMRARHGLLLKLEGLGEDDEAIAHMHAMLVLNPNDNQGIRYLLLASLVRRGESKAVDALIASYADEWSVQWLYTKALIAFRKKRAATKTTLKVLKDAFDVNKHVPAALARTDVAAPPPTAFLVVGGPDEAADYAEHFGAAWRSTEGAIEWLGTMKTNGLA